MTIQSDMALLAAGSYWDIRKGTMRGTPGQCHFEANVYLIPFVETETEFFLKTIIPSRKATKT